MFSREVGKKDSNDGSCHSKGGYGVQRGEKSLGAKFRGDFKNRGVREYMDLPHIRMAG